MPLHDLATPPVRMRLKGRIDDLAEALALKVALLSAHLKATCYARARRSSPHAGTSSPRGRDPSTPPGPRFQIVELKNLLAWPADQIARLFRVCTHTIHNWEMRADSTAHTVGTTVRQAPPITRFADAVRNTVHLMADFGFGRDETTALVLARAGWKISPRSVARIRKEKSQPKLEPPTPEPPHETTHPVVARFIHHVWHSPGPPSSCRPTTRSREPRQWRSSPRAR